MSHIRYIFCFSMETVRLKGISHISNAIPNHIWLIQSMKNISPEPALALGNASTTAVRSKAQCQVSYGCWVGTAVPKGAKSHSCTSATGPAHCTGICEILTPVSFSICALNFMSLPVPLPTLPTHPMRNHCQRKSLQCWWRRWSKRKNSSPPWETSPGEWWRSSLCSGTGNPSSAAVSCTLPLPDMAFLPMLP